MKMLSVGMQGVADVDINRISLMTTLGGLELVFDVGGRTTLPDPNFWVTAHSADVHLGGAKGPVTRLGVARPVTPQRDRTGPAPLPVGWAFRLPITAHQLAAIEDLRDGGDLQFKLVLSGEGGPYLDLTRVERLNDELYRQLGQSDWVRELNSAKAMDVLLLEIAMPFVDPPAAGQKILEALRTAQQLFAQGNYAQSVGSCRTAMDGLKALEGRDDSWKSQAYSGRNAVGGASKMTQDQRELVLEAALHEFVHLGAHPEGEQFSQRNARLAIAVTASILAFRLR
jgi:hypothetical protein